jgi:hypothetical protein
VRNGTVNHNALNHVFTLSTDLNVDYLTWESFDVPVNRFFIPVFVFETSDRTLALFICFTQIPYSREINVSDEKVIRYITMSGSNSGVIPVARETVATEIICSGLLDAEVEIEFHFNLTVDNSLSNFTQISFKRKKLCHRGEHGSTFYSLFMIRFDLDFGLLL